MLASRVHLGRAHAGCVRAGRCATNAGHGPAAIIPLRQVACHSKAKGGNNVGLMA